MRSMKAMMAALVLFGASATARAAAAEWRLESIQGNVAHKWAEGPNWTWEKNNPREDRGAMWTLFHQADYNAPRVAPRLPMTPGLGWGYTWLWLGEKGPDGNPLSYYTEKYRLAAAARPAAEKDGRGKPVGIMFQPPEVGAYTIDLAAAAKVAQPTAGHAYVDLFLIDTETKDVTLLAEFRVNSPNGYQNLPSEFTWRGEAEFKESTALVLRLMSVNPGLASCGPASVYFERFVVSK